MSAANVSVVVALLLLLLSGMKHAICRKFDRLHSATVFVAFYV